MGHDRRAERWLRLDEELAGDELQALPHARQTETAIPRCDQRCRSCTCLEGDTSAASIPQVATLIAKCRETLLHAYRLERLAPGLSPFLPTCRLPRPITCGAWFVVGIA